MMSTVIIENENRFVNPRAKTVLEFTKEAHHCVLVSTLGEVVNKVWLDAMSQCAEDRDGLASSSRKGQNDRHVSITPHCALAHMVLHGSLVQIYDVYVVDEEIAQSNCEVTSLNINSDAGCCGHYELTLWSPKSDSQLLV